MISGNLYLYLRSVYKLKTIIMAIVVEKLNSMNVRIITKDTSDYFIESNVTFTDNELGAFESGTVKTLDKNTDLAYFNSNGSFTVTFQNVSDFTEMGKIMTAIETYMTEVKTYDPATILPKAKTGI